MKNANLIYTWIKFDVTHVIELFLLMEVISDKFKLIFLTRATVKFYARFKLKNKSKFCSIRIKFNDTFVSWSKNLSYLVKVVNV